ncbi:ATP-binding protein [bacterium]|nr:ATP-binding protein [bacterium]MBU1957367.1 ATP-binding protein [bacterium]
MITRKILSKILNEIDSQEIIFLLGTRQVGKTTLSKLIAKESAYDNVYFFDFEDKEYRELFNDVSVKKLEQIFKIEAIDILTSNLIIFDEIQLLDDPSNMLKLIYDHFKTLKVIATGSSSLQIKAKFSDSLAGRKKVYRIEPLDFDEFLLFKGEEKLLRLRGMFQEERDKLSMASIVLSQSKRFLELFEEYLIYGGYPEVVLLDSRDKKIAKLDSIASSYIQKDIKDLANIENIDGYNKLIQYLSINIGNMINLSSISTAIGLSLPTVKKYINLLQETFIVDELKPFFRNKNKEISKNGKIFFGDIGVRNLQIKNFNTLSYRVDVGELYENYVFNRLQSQEILSTLYMYRTQSKTEIDFVHIEESVASLYEVKSGSNSKVPKAIVEFEKRYSNEFHAIEKYVINRDILDIKREILFIPAFLL